MAKSRSTNPSRPGVLDKLKMADWLEKNSQKEGVSPKTRAKALRVASNLRKIHAYRNQD